MSPQVKVTLLLTKQLVQRLSTFSESHSELGDVNNLIEEFCWKSLINTLRPPPIKVSWKKPGAIVPYLSH